MGSDSDFHCFPVQTMFMEEQDVLGEQLQHPSGVIEANPPPHAPYSKVLLFHHFQPSQLVCLKSFYRSPSIPQEKKRNKESFTAVALKHSSS